MHLRRSLATPHSELPAKHRDVLAKLAHSVPSQINCSVAVPSGAAWGALLSTCLLGFGRLQWSRHTLFCRS